MRAAIRIFVVALFLAVTLCLPAAAAQETPAARPQTHEFRVLLLRATPGEPHLPDDLHPAAVTALTDVQDVLVFRRFELIDSAWVRTDQGAQIHLGDAGSYRVGLFLDSAASTAGNLVVSSFELSYRYVLRSEGGRAHLSESRDLLGTSFGIRVGETVVVGTSRAEAENEALVVLLQAVR